MSSESGSHKKQTSVDFDEDKSAINTLRKVTKFSIDSADDERYNLARSPVPPQTPGEFHPNMLVNDIYVPIHNGDFNYQKVVIKKESTHSFVADELSHEADMYYLIREKSNTEQPSFVINMLHYFCEFSPQYIVFEKFGENLCAFFERKSAVKSAIFEQLLLAINALHDCGVVHCDVKPQNILVFVTSTGVVELKLCDLDSAQKIGFPMQTDLDGNIKCSQAWVSPEVYLHGRGGGGDSKGSLSASYAIDVFSV
eukprot:gene36021-44428_t